MKTEKEILKENGLTNIDELMDVQFGKPGTLERERFHEEARTYVIGLAKTAECRKFPKRNRNNRLFPSVLTVKKHYLRNVKFFSDADVKRWLFKGAKNNRAMYSVEY